MSQWVNEATEAISSKGKKTQGAQKEYNKIRSKFKFVTQSAEPPTHPYLMLVRLLEVLPSEPWG